MSTIVHLDLDAFFCAVEERRNPLLRGKCFAVGGSPQHRGVVSSCSYAAREYGVHSAMPMSQAIRLCPDLITVPGSHSLYRQYSHHVMAVLRQFTTKVEQISIDEAFLDVSEVEIGAREIGQAIQTRVNREVHLPCSLGIAGNKLVAKIANDYGKGQFRGNGFPNALTVVTTGMEADFLRLLPVRSLWGVGPKTASRLDEMGISTIGDLAVSSPDTMFRSFGQTGLELVQHANGRDDRPVYPGSSQSKSISEEHTFPIDTTDEMKLREQIKRIVRNITRRMNDQRLRASVVRIKLRWADFETITRQRSCSATDDMNLIDQLAESLFDQAWALRQPVRLIGVGVAGLSQKSIQLNLWDVEVQKNQRIFDTMADISVRFGNDVILFGKDLQTRKQNEERSNENPP
ncbi:MAG: DNA polymerase IV [Anaerolineae bacterium]|nr:DNA polymerase IV [Anaerolineae bacterium]